MKNNCGVFQVVDKLCQIFNFTIAFILFLYKKSISIFGCLWRAAKVRNRLFPAAQPVLNYFGIVKNKISGKQLRNLAPGINMNIYPATRFPNVNRNKLYDFFNHFEWMRRVNK